MSEEKYTAGQIIAQNPFKVEEWREQDGETKGCRNRVCKSHCHPCGVIIMNTADKQMDIFDFMDGCPEPEHENPSPKTQFEQIFDKVKDPMVCCTNCLCQYCTHNAEELYNTIKLEEAAGEPCFNCDWCRIYNGDCRLKNEQKEDCADFTMSDYGAGRNRKRIKLIKK